jgi:hypothetical protein
MRPINSSAETTASPLSCPKRFDPGITFAIGNEYIRLHVKGGAKSSRFDAALYSSNMEMDSNLKYEPLATNAWDMKVKYKADIHKLDNPVDPKGFVGKKSKNGMKNKLKDRK